MVVGGDDVLVPVPVPWFGRCAALLLHASTGTCFCFALLCCFHFFGMDWCPWHIFLVWM